MAVPLETGDVPTSLLWTENCLSFRFLADWFEWKPRSPWHPGLWQSRGGTGMALGGLFALGRCLGDT